MSHDHQHHEPGEFSLRRLLVRLLLAALVVVVLVGWSMSFQVSEGYNAVVTRFGDPIDSVEEAGFGWKWPWPIERVQLIDMRRRTFNTPYTATFTRDRKNVVLLTYVIWRVEDPLSFLERAGTREEAERKLEGLVIDKKNYYLGRYDLAALVSTDAQTLKADEIEQAILAAVAPEARERIGIEVEQVGIKRVAYPKENMEAVLEQMRAERRAVAGATRAEGNGVAEGIRKATDVTVAQTLEKARQEYGRIVGEAENTAAQIAAKAREQDPEFYDYWLSLQVLRDTIRQRATVVLRNDEGLIKLLFTPPEVAEPKSTSTEPPQPVPPAPADQTTLSALPTEDTP